jgi:RNA polymerase sigma-54 factor
MEMRQGLRITQQQKLVITPRLQQALKLLQAPTLELEQMLKTELYSNPMLELEEEYAEGPETDVTEAESDSADHREVAEERQASIDADARELPTAPEAPATERLAESPAERTEGDHEDGPETPERAELDDYKDFFQDGSDSSTTRSEEKHEEFIERVPVSKPSLDEHLMEQLRYRTMSDMEEAIGEYLVGSIDERGYLTMSVEEVAAELDVEPALVEKVLGYIHALDPPGIGARDLRECLLLQLKARKLEGSLAWKVVDQHFDDMMSRRQNDIARALKVGVEDIQEALDLVGNLAPAPGNEVSGTEAQYVYPDLIVERVGEDYVVTLNDKNVPRLRISSAFEHVLNGGEGGDGTARDYVLSKLNSARWLIQTIEQRRRTMVKVMKAIVEEQRDFFDKGIMHMRPLTLQDIASKIGMHESTVSRVTSAKYVQTPRGVFELKFFFSSGIDTTQGGEEVSAKAAKAIIAKLIEGEEKRDPLSDQKLAEILKGQGLDIARRTVAKYREQLHISNARLRKRH